MSIAVSEFIQHYFIAIITCVGLLLFLYMNRMVSNKILRIFTTTIFMIAVVIFSETTERILGELDHYVFCRSLMSAIGYISRVGIVFCIVQVPTRNWYVRYKLLNAIPFFANAAIVIISMYNGIVFSFDGSNEFVRGPLGALPFVVSAYYLVELVVSSFFKFKKRDYQEGIICTFVMIFCAIAVYFELVYNLTGLLPSMAIVSLAFYYTNFVVNRYSKDQLTDAFLRSRFYEDIKKIRHPTYIISIDLNGLKLVNDSLGHLEGDKYLKKFAITTYAVVKSNARVYRVGGDEFVILYRTQNEKIIEKVINDIRHKLSNTGVTFAVGYTLCNSSDDFTKSFSDADAKMYLDKTEYHKNNK